MIIVTRSTRGQIEENVDLTNVRSMFPELMKIDDVVLGAKYIVKLTKNKFLSTHLLLAV